MSRAATPHRGRNPPWVIAGFFVMVCRHAPRLGETKRISTSPEVAKLHKDVDQRDKNPDESEKPTYLG